MMVLQRGNIIVEKSELGSGIDLIYIVVTGVVEIVANASRQKYESVEISHFVRNVHRPNHHVHLQTNRIKLIRNSSTSRSVSCQKRTTADIYTRSSSRERKKRNKTIICF